MRRKQQQQNVWTHDVATDSVRPFPFNENQNGHIDWPLPNKSTQTIAIEGTESEQTSTQPITYILWCSPRTVWKWTANSFWNWKSFECPLNEKKQSIVSCIRMRHAFIQFEVIGCAYLDLVIQVYLSVSKQNTAYALHTHTVHHCSSSLYFFIQKRLSEVGISMWTIYISISASSVFNSHARIRNRRKKQTKRISKNAKRLLDIDDARKQTTTTAMARQQQQPKRQKKTTKSEKKERNKRKNVLNWIFPRHIQFIKGRNQVSSSSTTIASLWKNLVSIVPSAFGGKCCAMWIK